LDKAAIYKDALGTVLHEKARTGHRLRRPEKLNAQHAYKEGKRNAPPLDPKKKRKFLPFFGGLPPSATATNWRCGIQPLPAPNNQ
jgi:hypothetical protein